MQKMHCFPENLHSWQEFYTTVGRGSRDKFQLCLCTKIFSWLPHMYSDSQKKFEIKPQCKIFHDGTLRGGHLNSEKPVGFCYPACMGLPWKI